MVDPFGAQSNNQRENTTENRNFGQTGYFSRMQIEEIAFPEPNDISKSELDKSRLIGPYHKQKLLGKGGMGMVWQVRDPLLQRTMALKILHTAFFRRSIYPNVF